ncbi:MAG: SatD family protein [Alicyclobacillus sp.]|nr:SatD family protein [Alicyclobacillus sp.]
MSDYCAVLFDLKRSRMLANRSQVQKTLIQSIKTYNAEFSSVIVAPFLVILGDEWQGLLREGADYESTIHFFASQLQLPFYVGVGIGECTVVDEELTVNQMDGPAFYKARHALKLAKEFGYTKVIIE